MQPTLTQKEQDKAPYSVIAKGYDLIMAHVDYDYWAQYTDQLLWQFHENPLSVRELGCGTGTFAIHLQPLGPYEYTATDISPFMVDMARQKAEHEEAPIQFEIEDFSSFTVKSPHDVIVLLYDGLNYLLEEDKVLSLFECCMKALKPGGIFFFDQSTPANSINNEAYFSDEGSMEGFSYIRRSEYNKSTCLHTTTFEIQLGEETFFEKHVQRAYSQDTVKALLEKAGFKIEMAFDGFTAKPASDLSERIHWLVRRP